jgi:hypothetical protein
VDGYGWMGAMVLGREVEGRGGEREGGKGTAEARPGRRASRQHTSPRWHSARLKKEKQRKTFARGQLSDLLAQHRSTRARQLRELQLSSSTLRGPKGPVLPLFNSAGLHLSESLQISAHFLGALVREQKKRASNGSLAAKACGPCDELLCAFQRFSPDQKGRR